MKLFQNLFNKNFFLSISALVFLATIAFTNFGYIKDSTYTAQPRPGEDNIGIRAMRNNPEYYKEKYKF